MAPYIVRSSGRRWSSIENSRCQSAGLALRAAAYEVLFALSGLDDDVRGAVLGVATRVPSGVWASTLLPSEGVGMRQPQGHYRGRLTISNGQGNSLVCSRVNIVFVFKDLPR
jgi:hypothetical protein